MTEPQTEAGREFWNDWAPLDLAGEPTDLEDRDDLRLRILAIENEARADALAGITDDYKEATDAAMNFGDGYKHGRADALREAAERVRALGEFDFRTDVLDALLQAEPTPEVER